MATFTVTTTDESGAGSLRQAVLDANAAAGADEIRFDANVFDGELGDLIRLTSGQIEITDELTILAGPAGVKITGDRAGNDEVDADGITDVAASGSARLADNSRIFAATTALTLDGLTLTGGRTTSPNEGGGALRGTTVTLIDSTVSGNSTAGNYAGGGGVAGGDVTLTNSVVSDNSAVAGGGGGISGSTRLTDSTVSGNTSAGGGGIYGSTTALRSIISDNHALGFGGGIYGDTHLTDSTVSGNSSEYGGGISGSTIALRSTISKNQALVSGGGIYSFSSREIRLTDSTISGNSSSGDGAAVSAYGGIYGAVLAVSNSTISGNIAVGEGGVFDLDRMDLVLENSIVLGNSTDTASAYRLFLRFGNIFDGVLRDGEAEAGSITAAEVFAATEEVAPGVLAGVLADNGGSTQTIAIRAEGPATGAARFATSSDQRGFLRDEAPDLGAFEAGAVPPQELPSLIVDTALDVVADDGRTSLREAVSFANAQAGADTITFDEVAFAAGSETLIRLFGPEIAITDALAIVAEPGRVTINGDRLGNDATDEEGFTDVSGSSDEQLSDNVRIFDADVALTLDGLTLTGGRSTLTGGSGGALRGTEVTLIDARVVGNSVTGYGAGGGGVYGEEITVVGSVVSGNAAANSGYVGGGGIAGRTITVSDSIVSDNVAEVHWGGGGIDGDYVLVTNSTISHNAVFSSNYAQGGGIRGRDVVVLRSSTVTGNIAGGEGSSQDGGGVYASNLTLTDSIVLGNATTDAFGEDEVSSYSSRNLGGNIVGRDIFDGAADVGDVAAAEVFAEVEEIAPGVFAGVHDRNGGPTRTVAIRADGPAAGAADPATATPTDQRGVARDAAPDLGAFEAGAEAGLVLTGGPDPDTLSGSEFADTIRGQGGADALRGVGGDDFIHGGKGSDVIKGGEGDDVLCGGKGRDWIEGGLGDDMMRGGKCLDRFVFRADFGDDVIADFDANPRCGQDRIDLRGLGITAASFAAEVKIAVESGDTLVEVRGQGSVLLRGVDGGAADAVDGTDFLFA